MATFTDKKEIFRSTQVTQALKRSLDTDGTWRTIHSKEIGTPSPPPPEGTHYTYYKDDGLLYSMDSTGTETQIGSGGDAAEALLLAQNVQTTGLTEGGLISANVGVGTTIDITSGQGYITDFSDPVNPNTMMVSFNAQVSHTPTGDGTFIAAFDEDGVFSEITRISVTNQVRRTHILVGGYTVDSGIIVGLDTAPLNLGYDGLESAKDFMRDVIGPATISGNTFSANVGGNLNVDNFGGGIFVLASNFRDDVEIPDERTIAPATAFTFFPVYRDSGPTGIITLAPSTFIDGSLYDDGSGILQSVADNDWTVKVGYISPSGQYVFAFGQGTPFNTQADAEAAVLNNTYEYEERAPLTDFVRRSFLVVKGNATNLTTQATFIDEAKFRGGGVNVSGGVPGVNAPGGTNKDIQFNDNTLFGGDSDFTWDKTAKSLEIEGTLETSSENIGPTISGATVGNGFLTDLDNPNIISLTSSRVVVSDIAAETITVYDFDGNDWTQVGTPFDVTDMNVPGAAPLTPNTFAFIDRENGLLRKLQFNGSVITQDGNALDLSTITSKPILTALGENRVAFVEGAAILRVYDFDGTDWAQVGNDFDLVNSGFTGMSALGTNRIAYVDIVLDIITAYDFDGTNWVKVGNDFSDILGAVAMASMSTSEIVTVHQSGNTAHFYRFDGVDWTFRGEFSLVALNTPDVAVLDTNRFVVVKETSDPTLGMQAWQVLKPVNTVIDGEDKQLSGISDTGFTRIDRMEVANSLYIKNDSTGLPSLMVKGKSQFGGTIDTLKDIRFPDGTTQDTSAQPAVNFVPVFEEDDFGTVVSGYHQLADNTIYEIRNPSLVMTDGLKAPSDENVEIRGAGFVTNEILFGPSTSRFFMRGPDAADIYIHDLVIKFTTANTGLFEIADSDSLRFHNIKLDAGNIGNLGTIDDVPMVSMNNIDLRNFQNGFDMFNISGFIDNFFMTTAANISGISYFYLDSNIPSTVEINNGIVDIKVDELFIDIGEDALDANTSILIKGIDLINSNSGEFFDSDGVDQSDPRIITIANFDTKDSSVTGEAFLEGNTNVTLSDAVNAVTIVDGGTLWTFQEEERLDGNTTGDIKVTSKEPVSVSISGDIIMRPDASAFDLSARFVKIGAEDRVVTFDDVSSQIEETATTRVNGDTITFFDTAGTLPPELQKAKIYYVVNQNVNDFQVAYTLGGTDISFSTGDAGTNSYSVASLLGSAPERNIDVSDAKDIRPKAIAVVETDDKIAVTVTNKDNGTDNIIVESAYVTIHK